MTYSDYWLASWIDEHDIRDVRTAKKYLTDKRHADDLAAFAAEARPPAEPHDEAERTTIVAGRTIDLSGELGCVHSECLRDDLDRLFSHIWHYFDIIVVAGLTPAHALELLGSWQSDNTRERFLAYIDNFLYVRKIGAEDMLVYRQKPPACTAHMREHAKQYGASSILKRREIWISSFAVGAEIASLDRHDDHWHYAVNHPDMEHTSFGVLQRKTPKGRKPKDAEVFGAVFDEFAANLISDIGAAGPMRSPLGAAAPVHQHLLANRPVTIPNMQDVIFSINLPVVPGLSTRDLLKLRREDWQYFDAFRSALTTAASEYLPNSKDGVDAALLLGR